MDDSTGPQSASASGVRIELGHTLRADAARNRLRILAAAERLFAEQGVAAVSMDAIAAAAGVGKGTLFRRFGDKAGLAVALLDERERELQAAVISGPPPLGPGADPGRRLVAFVESYLGYAHRHLDVLRLSENAAPGARYRIGSYRLWHRHVSMLIGAAGAVDDPDAAAHLLLAGLAAEVLAALAAEGYPPDRLGAAAADLARRLTRPNGL